MRSYQFVLCLVLIGTSLTGHAQKTYRCEVEGRTTYQQTACAQGASVDLSDRPSAEQHREAKAVAKREARLATDLERERLAREAAVVPAGAAGINGQAMPTRASPPTPGQELSKKKSATKKTHR